MTKTEELDQRLEALKGRFARLSEASLRVNESLELDVVLQGVLDSARSLTGARYGVITTLDESGQAEDFLGSGFNPEEQQSLWDLPCRGRIFEYLSGLTTPLRVRDFFAHLQSTGLPEIESPMPISAVLTAPIRHRNDGVGSIYLAMSEPGEEFSREDEDTLTMFATQAALVIANARRHRDERRARADLETLIETSPVGVAVLDGKTGAVVSYNREASRIVDGLIDSSEQSPIDLAQSLTIRRADGREISLADTSLSEVLSADETVRAEEIVLQVPGGGRITTLVNATPIRGDGGGIESFVITMQDMTPLEEMAHLRVEFLSMVSSELRVPIASIKGASAIALGKSADLDPAMTRQFFNIIDGQADRMNDLVSDLLDVARIETGTLPISLEPVDVATLVERARVVFMAGGGRDNLSIHVAPELPLVMADRRRIVQVIGNLLTNAARRSPKSSVITVSAATEGASVALTIADQGKDTPEQAPSRQLKRLTMPAGEQDERADGLALSICKGIVEAHGGRIRVESDGPGLGTRFTFTIPTAQTSAGPGSSGVGWSSNAVQKAARNRQRVLVVDGDPRALWYVRDTLSDGGYYPILTSDSEEALRLMKEHRPRLVLLDIMLPGANSIDLMRDLFAIAEVPVVFLSPYGRDQLLAQAFESGASDYIVKPFSPSELLARVRAALPGRLAARPANPLQPYVLNAMTIDYAARQVFIQDEAVRLTPIEYNLLYELSINAGRVISHDHLLQRAWSPGKSGDLRALRTHMMRLRRKLGEDAIRPEYIYTVSRIGYRMPKSQSPEFAGV